MLYSLEDWTFSELSGGFLFLVGCSETTIGRHNMFCPRAIFRNGQRFSQTRFKYPLGGYEGFLGFNNISDVPVDDRVRCPAPGRRPPFFIPTFPVFLLHLPTPFYPTPPIRFLDPLYRGKSFFRRGVAPPFFVGLFFCVPAVLTLIKGFFTASLGAPCRVGFPFWMDLRIPGQGNSTVGLRRLLFPQ